MRIVYSGLFLEEGFTEAGCEVVPLRLDATKTLDELVGQTGVDPDLVFIEALGRTELPREIHASRHPLALYCIDSPLNEYWLIPLAKLFDHVFVDQRSSVKSFRREGVGAKWLPLCASRTDFRQAADKRHLITFVGRVTPQRVKRTNLLKHIAERFPVNIVQGVSRPAMLDAFAASRIVLNENFFPGLNLRFFQALASGSLLLTERLGHGVERHFQEGDHYLGYAPGDVLDTIAAIERSPESFEHVAAQGQAECARLHTSASRARTVLGHIGSPLTRSRRARADDALNEAQAKYFHALRFGGNFDESARYLKHAPNGPAPVMAQAACTLGSIDLRAGRREPGVAYLERSASTATIAGLNATLKLMLVFAEEERLLHYVHRLLTILKELRISRKKYFPYINLIRMKKDVRYNICMLGYELLSDLQCNFDLGFHKEQAERYPDYAVEFAHLAYEEKRTEESLEAIIRCANAAGAAPIALEYIQDAILSGAASDKQIALSASLAVEYYDFAYAETAVKALKRSIV